MKASTSPFSLEGKVALVTGGSGGLGMGMARGLAEQGADLVLVARHTGRLKRAERALAGTGRRVWTLPFDLGNTEAIPALFADALKSAGRLDILVNNAGMTHRCPAERIAPSVWDHVMRVNLVSMLRLSQAFAAECRRRKKPGKIINVGSLLCDRSREGNAPYAASKAAVLSLTRSMALEWAPYRINVNAIGPGYFQTDLTEPLYRDEAFSRWVKSKTPFGRWGKPADLAGAAVFLAAAASDFVTGQILYVDGGWLTKV